MKISQREARRLKKRVFELERLESVRNNRFASEYPGVYLAQETPEPYTKAAIETARKLRFAVAVQIHNDKLNFYAVPLKGMPTA